MMYNIIHRFRDKTCNLTSPSYHYHFQDLDMLLSAKTSPMVIPQVDNVATNGRSYHSIFEVDFVPLCGQRPEMEDAVAALPRFMKIPLRMLIGDRKVNGVASRLSHLIGGFSLESMMDMEVLRLRIIVASVSTLLWVRSWKWLCLIRTTVVKSFGEQCS